jgi:hypothetical protein
MKMHPQAKTARGHITGKDGGGGHPQSKTGSARVMKSTEGGEGGMPEGKESEMEHAKELCCGKMMKGRM